MNFLFALFFTALSFAADPSQFIVKTMSAKAGQGASYVGSGVLVRFHGQAYVLTSEHVILPAKEADYTQRYLLDGQATHEMEFLFSDWAFGLSLLKAADVPADTVLPDLEALTKTALPKEGQGAMLVGFPARAQSITADTDGKIDSITRISSILVDVPNMIEIKNAQAEFGMSGGAVFDENAEVIGILSHESPNLDDKTVFAIPIAQAAQWAIRALTEPNFQPELMRSAGDMLLQGRYGYTIRSQDLIFRLGTFAYQNKLPSIEISGCRENEGVPTKLVAGPFIERTANRIRGYWKPNIPVGYHPSVSVTGFKSPDFLRYRDRYPGISSLVDFFRRLRDPHLRAYALYSYAGQSLDHLDWDHQNLARQIRSQYSAGNAQAYLEALRAITSFSESSNGLDIYRDYPMYFINPDDIEMLLRLLPAGENPQFRAIVEELQKIIDQISI